MTNDYLSTRNWVLFSTPQSFIEKKISILAIAETIVASIVYLILAARYGTLHITLAAIIAPLILTRTKESVKFALFHSKSSTSTAILAEKCDVPYLKQSYICLTASFSVLIFMYTAVYLLSPANELPSVLENILLFSVVSIYVLLIISAVAVMIYILLPLCIRIVANLHGIYLSPKKSISNIPRNWWANVAYIDSLHPPEILPGAILYDNSKNRVSVLQPYGYTLTRLRLSFRNSTGNSLQKKYVEVCRALFEATSLLIAAVPTLLYRWSLKGSSLLLAPLIWLVYDADHARPEHIVKSTLMKSLFNFSLAIVALYLGLGASYALRLDIGSIIEIPESGIVALLSGIVAQKGFLAIKVFSFLTAIATIVCYLCSERLHVRGYTNRDLWQLKALMHLIGVFSVFLIFSLVYTFSYV